MKSKYLNFRSSLLILCILFFVAGCGDQSGKVVNVYSHRHYEADQMLYDKFTEETGIKVNVVSASADELIQRLELEGKGSPADILITVDAGRLARAQQKELLQPISSEILSTNIPDKFRDPDGHWFGLTYRARIIAYSKDRVNPGQLSTYEDLVNPIWKGKILTRSSENIYNQSLLASLIAAHGEEMAESWASGVYENMARPPKGNDRDQVIAIAASEGDLAIVNTYYIGIMLNDENEQMRQAAEKVSLYFPNQDDRGTHVNISGAGITHHAPNKENAIQLLEFLSGEYAQGILANTNYEYPVNPKVPPSDLLNSWGAFKSDDLNLSKLGEYNQMAVKLFDKVGWN